MWHVSSSGRWLDGSRGSRDRRSYVLYVCTIRCTECCTFPFILLGLGLSGPQGILAGFFFFSPPKRCCRFIFEIHTPAYKHPTCRAFCCYLVPALVVARLALVVVRSALPFSLYCRPFGLCCRLFGSCCRSFGSCCRLFGPCYSLFGCCCRSFGLYFVARLAAPLGKQFTIHSPLHAFVSGLCALR